MARSVENLKGRRAKLECLAILKTLGSELEAFLGQKEVFGMEIDGNVEDQLEFGGGSEMVRVTVSKENSLRCELLFENGGGDEVGLISGIDDESF